MPSTVVMPREGSFALAPFGRVRKFQVPFFAAAFGCKSFALTDLGSALRHSVSPRLISAHASRHRTGLFTSCLNSASRSKIPRTLANSHCPWPWTFRTEPQPPTALPASADIAIVHSFAWKFTAVYYLRATMVSVAFSIGRLPLGRRWVAPISPLVPMFSLAELHPTESRIESIKNRLSRWIVATCRALPAVSVRRQMWRVGCLRAADPHLYA